MKLLSHTVLRTSSCTIRSNAFVALCVARARSSRLTSCSTSPTCARALAASASTYSGGATSSSPPASRASLLCRRRRPRPPRSRSRNQRRSRSRSLSPTCTLVSSNTHTRTYHSPSLDQYHAYEYVDMDSPPIVALYLYEFCCCSRTLKVFIHFPSAIGRRVSCRSRRASGLRCAASVTSSSKTSGRPALRQSSSSLSTVQ